jgi:hypothetical protein
MENIHGTVNFEKNIKKNITKFGRNITIIRNITQE